MKKIDITQHIYVPKHVKLSEKEVNELVNNYNISIKQLAKIFIKDPAIKGTDVKAGDVIKIVRKSQTVGKAVSYRVVVDG